MGPNRAGVHGKLQDARRPPILPDDFERDMETKALTNGKDKEVVIKLQREVATTVLGGVESLDFSSGDRHHDSTQCTRVRSRAKSVRERRE